MGWFTTVLRRSLWLVLIVAAGGALWSWRRDAADASPPGPAEWPPLVTTTPAESAGGWLPSLDDGSCPIGYPIKANEKSGIFHVPAGRFYERTKPERCYSDADAARRDGYRQAKN